MTAALRRSTASASGKAPARLVIIRPAPPREPPFDDELTEPPLVGRYDQRLPFARPCRVTSRLPQPRRLGALPDPGAWGRRLLVGLIEAAAGRRPLSQLAALLSLSVIRGIGTDFERAAVSGRPHWLHRAAVRSVRATEPADGVAELCATIETGQRIRAVALRLEAQNGRWRCTRLQIG